ncbi:hypothetical protein PFICI_05493 [Pestalotiopsis fici W106-1]|uniref:Hydrophobin n=1 Tax=Pestalotiopsis fici (strain W106-1 / CGMCC3.15140) TaxID=1229662 RepID=W3XDW4_PESFW|nr:uncharacterized protein PFICI_05493 [Pestalotiopsis fici W106-1]ETS83617.1 hypothetical protein PFICI_05493 [Pestalotiopsis fici W106-1]
MKWTSFLLAQSVAVAALTISASISVPTATISEIVAPTPTIVPSCPPLPTLPLPIIPNDACVIGCVADFLKALQKATHLVCPAIYPPPPYCVRPVERAIAQLRLCLIGCGRPTLPLPATPDVVAVVFCPLAESATA